ncbi:MAG: OmpA family protein [Myxococcales bacterium]|nr:OmpA family protein [Myxococcales bacterium]
MRRGVLTLGLAAGAVGCQASASGSFNVDSSADAKAEGDASFNADANAKTDEPKPATLDVSAVKGFRKEGGKLDYSGNIEFEYNKANLRSDPETQSTLKELVDYLKKYPEVKLEIEGHTDSRGSDRYNKDLSNRRAASLRKWLIGSGIDEDRLTSVGYGESKPQVEEPEACHNKTPDDSSQCEEPWQRNRRVVFAITAGAETIPEEPVAAPAPEPEPEPAPEPVAPAPEPKPSCPTNLLGFHINALGPNSFFGAEAAWQPLCWLELSGGLYYGFAKFTEDANGAEAKATAHKFNIPVRGRVWFMETHSLLAELGVLGAHYRVNGHEENAPGEFDYERTSTHLGGFVGLGYGYRSEAPWRIAAVIGGLVQSGDMDPSDTTSNLPAATAQALKNAFDSDTDGLLDAKLYGELSFGLLW